MKIRITNCKPSWKSNLIEDYPSLKKYEEWFIKKDTALISKNEIVKEMDESEFVELIRLLMKEEHVDVILSPDWFGIDYEVKICDDYIR